MRSGYTIRPAVALAGVALFLLVAGVACGGGGSKTSPGAVAGSPEASAEEAFQGGPRAYVAEPVVDFGQVPFNKVVSHTFRLKNVGDKPLKIEDVSVKTLEGC